MHTVGQDHGEYMCIQWGRIMGNTCAYSGAGSWGIHVHTVGQDHGEYMCIQWGRIMGNTCAYCIYLDYTNTSDEVHSM